MSGVRETCQCGAIPVLDHGMCATCLDEESARLSAETAKNLTDLGVAIDRLIEDRIVAESMLRRAVAHIEILAEHLPDLLDRIGYQDEEGVIKEALEFVPEAKAVLA